MANFLALSKAEIDDMRWRHPMLSLDIALGTTIPGEYAWDDKLNGYIVLGKDYIWYWTDEKPEDISLIGQAVEPVSKAVWSVALPLVVLGVVILLILRKT